jgi:hypothetical protein
MASVSLDSREHESLFLRRQEVAVFWKWRDGRPASDTDKDSDAALDDEDPFLELATVAKRVCVKSAYHLHAA